MYYFYIKIYNKYDFPPLCPEQKEDFALGTVCCRTATDSISEVYKMVKIKISLNVEIVGIYVEFSFYFGLFRNLIG